MANSPRTFEDKPATRERVPLLVGLTGPSGGGKTYSALRVATGIQRVTGGDIYVIDTEARRALHYADRFRFRHLPFGSPFGPLDYLAAIEHCLKKGAKIIVVDSASHEHEGPGGVLEMHQAEVERLSKGIEAKTDGVKMLAWSKPKSERRRLINSILQMNVNFIFCFRAKEKIKIVRGKNPENQGFMPIAGEEFVFEMTCNALLLPNAGGVPTWQSAELGERQMIKLPEQFRSLFATEAPLSEEAGEIMARWAEGDVNSVHSKMVSAINAAATPEALERLVPGLKEIASKKTVSEHEYRGLRDLFAARKAALKADSERKSEPKNAEPPPDVEEPGEGADLSSEEQDFREPGEEG